MDTSQKATHIADMLIKSKSLTEKKLNKIILNLIFSIIFLFVFLLNPPILNAADKKNDSKKDKNKIDFPTVLKADEVHGDKINNTIDAIGDAELTKNDSIIYADKMSYDKNQKTVHAMGNVKIKNFQIGNAIAESADVKDDMSSGYLDKAKIIFLDGSYIKSPKITRLNPNQTEFETPIFSICPNPLIADDNNEAGKKTDTLSLKSTKTVVDKEKNSVKIKHAIFRIYEVPIFYSPYLSIPLPSSEKKSGFLPPSYASNSRLGLGINIPYYFNIAEDKDLTTTLRYHPGGNHIIVANQYRHLFKAGLADINLEVANNEQLKNTANYSEDVNEEKRANIRWYGKSKGDFKMSKNSNLAISMDTVSDKAYLRDYKNSLIDNTVSEIDFDNTQEKRNYYSVKTVRIQELSPIKDERYAPTALPILNSYLESKPGSAREKYSLLSNATVISREMGQQYRRVSVKPGVNVPYNLKGNLFNASASVQGDIYNVEGSNPGDSNNANYTNNYRPQAALEWSLPLIRKSKQNVMVIEPMANFVISSFRNNFNKTPNEDTGDIQLTQSNLFSEDRFAGFDRNESGQRFTYGAKSSLANSLGQFGFGLGQSIRRNSKQQDVIIKGFNDGDTSNIVGEASYKTKKHFSINYNFHLNESSYSNDINEVTTTLNFDKTQFFSNYILIRSTPDNPEKREQLDLGATFNIFGPVKAIFLMSRNMIDGRILNRRLDIINDGCCLVYGFAISESNPSSFVKPERSYNINFTIKNL